MFVVRNSEMTKKGVGGDTDDMVIISVKLSSGKEMITEV
jgi:hypothetical protein